MSSQEVSLSSVTLKQYFYKLKAYSTLVNGLIILHIFALLISLGGVSNIASGNGELSLSIKYYSANIAIAFAFFWIFFVAINLTTKQYKNWDFALVTNRVSSNLSNIGVLFSACVFGGLISTLFSVLLRVVIYFTSDTSQIILNGFYPAYTDLLLGIAIAILYMLLIAAAGYFVGVLTQINILFALIIPAVIVGLTRVDYQYAKNVLEFFISEASPLLFVLKIIATSILLFGLSVLVSNRMEVEK